MESRLPKRTQEVEGGQLGKKNGMSRKWREQRGNGRYILSKHTICVCNVKMKSTIFYQQYVTNN
jgi:hypothetical protein